MQFQPVWQDAVDALDCRDQFDDLGFLRQVGIGHVEMPRTSAQWPTGSLSMQMMAASVS